jgi:sortase A
LLFEVGLALVTAGVVVLLFVAYELVGTNLSEERSQAQLAREFSVSLGGTFPAVPDRAGGPGRSSQGKQPAEGTVALPATPPGGALDHLVIPVIGVDRYVVQGVAEGDLQMGPGHYPGTPLPGQLGNVGIAGHRTTFGAPFFRLNALVRGDLVYLTDTSGTTWVYRVVRQWVVPPADLFVLAPSRVAELTLTTCNPRFEATSRLVVRAVLDERLARGTKLPDRLPATTSDQKALRSASSRRTGPVATPVPVRSGASSSGAAQLPTSVGLNGGGTGAWSGSLGWGALALAGWVATRLVAARRYRHAKVLVLVAGALACLVPLWFAFESVVGLLPANI